MRIEIEVILKNENWCDYCPLLHIDREYPWSCGAEFWENDYESDQSMDKLFHIRPQVCKDKFGA